jgi:hypothetical protein
MVLESRAEIETLGAMWGPRRTFRRLIVDQHMDANNGDRMSNKVISVAMEALVGTKIGIRTIWAKMVDCNLGLGQALIPEIQGE